MRDPEFFASALALSDPIAIPGNKIERLTNGDEYFPAMLKAIGSAQQSVNFATYILHSDEVGRQFRDAREKKRRSPVIDVCPLDSIHFP